MRTAVLCVALLSLKTSAIFPLRKCCPDGACYDLGFPWTSLTRPVPPPRCIDEPATFLLTNRLNPVYPYVFITKNMSKIQEFYNPAKPTVMVFHGFSGSETSSFMRNITAVYLANIDANAFFVDYGKVTLNPYYPQAASDLRRAGTYVIKFVEYLIATGTSASEIHLIGMSLGAHLASYVAKAIPGIGRITGLDPAGPLFRKESCKVRLCKGDASFTEAIHTHGNPLFGFGTSDSDADVNFWVNGGWDQPKCGFVVNPFFFLHLDNAQGLEDYVSLFACSHGRSVFYYTEALASNCVFWGVRPNDYMLWISRLSLGHKTKFILNSRGCTPENCTPMGLDTINAAGRGDFIVATNWESPYCISQP